MEDKKSFFTPSVVRILTTLIVLIYFVLSTLGFFYFERSLILLSLFILIFIASISEFIVIKRALGFILFTLYLAMFSLSNFTYSGQFSTWLIYLVTLPLTFSIIALWKKSVRITWKKQDSILSIIISIILLEELVILHYFSLAPHIQAFLAVLTPLIAVDVVSDFRDNKLNFKRIFRISFLIILATVIILLSAPRGIM